MATPRKPVKSARKPAPAAAAIDRDADAGIEAAAEAIEAFTDGAGELQELLLKSTEHSLEKTVDACERIQASTGEATDAFGDACLIAVRGFSKVGTRTIDAFKSNADAQFEFMQALLRARQPSDLVTLQSTFLRHRMEAVQEQSVDLAASARKAAEDASAPLRAAIEKGFNVPA